MLAVIIFGMVLMAAQDLLGTMLVVSASRGRRWLAGTFDALGDFPNRLGAGVCGATLVKSGFGLEFALVGAMSLTSFFTTSWATKMSAKIKPQPT